MGVAQQQSTQRAKRVVLVRPCSYELMESHGEDEIALHEGDAMSVNVSSGGMLLLMSQAPHVRQIFEISMPASGGRKDKRHALVEARWTREVPVEGDSPLCLVGVKFLLTIPRYAGETLPTS